MYNGMFAFDTVVHMYDNRADNVIDPTAMRYMTKRFSMGGALEVDSNEDRATDIGHALRVMFEDAQLDLAMAQTVPLFSYWREGFAPAQLQYELAKADSRVIFCGGVDPVYQGLRGAIDEIDRQVTEWGATSFKFYQGHKGGISWRGDDRRVAYPLYERMQEYGLTVAQFHKGIPLGHERVEDLRPNDLQQAALDFPDMKFIIHHFGSPFIDETLNIASRFENVYVAMSSIINALPVAPWTVYESLGKAMAQVGEDRLLWGSEAFAYPTIRPYLAAFADMEIPLELQERYGYPSISRRAKKKILGLNMARLMNIDPAAALRAANPQLDQRIIDDAISLDPA
jgi:uncharacterized protein